MAANVGLSGAKYVVGTSAGSSALVADALHSAADVLTDVISWGSIHLSSRPPDRYQPFGWGHYDTLGSLALGVSLVTASIGTAYMAFDSLQKVLSQTSDSTAAVPLHLVQLGIATAVVSVACKEAIFRVTRRLAVESSSSILMASAYHHRSDALSSVVAGLAVGGSALSMPLLDPIGGLVVSTMIARDGVETVMRAVWDLTDRQTSESTKIIAKINKVAMSLASEDGGDLRGVHDVRLRRMGSANVADLHVVVDPHLSVTASYQTGEQLRIAVLQQVPEVTDLFIHVDAGEHAFHGPRTEAFEQSANNGAISEEGFVAPMGKHIIEKQARKVVGDLAKEDEPMLVGVSHVSVHYLAIDKGKPPRIILEVNLVFVPGIRYVVFSEVQRVGAKVKKVLLDSIRCVNEVDVHVELSHQQGSNT